MSPCPPTAMITPVFVVACLALAGQASAGLLSVGTEPTKFIVTYSGVPNFETFGFFTMPRTVKEATKSGFSKARGAVDGEKMEIYCRNDDFRVCVIFDLNGSVAGIQLSVKASEMEKFPVSAVGKPEWRRQTFNNQDVYTAVALFDSIDNINNGGRTMTSSTYTLPGNLYIQQSDANGKVTGYLEVSNKETGATLSGFKEQNCFIGMGKHYFQDLTPSSTCEEQRPYFLLYSPKTKNLQGFGFSWFGTPTTDARNWFESPPALAAKMIAPHSPDCMTDYINKYGMFTMHVYFVEKPWLTLC